MSRRTSDTPSIGMRELPFATRLKRWPRASGSPTLTTAPPLRPFLEMPGQAIGRPHTTFIGQRRPQFTQGANGNRRWSVIQPNGNCWRYQVQTTGKPRTPSIRQ